MSDNSIGSFLEGRDLIVEVAHDDHRARFRPATAREAHQYNHHHEQIRIAIEAMEKVVGEGSDPSEYCRALPAHWDGNAMRPCGVELAKGSVWVCGLDENGESKWVNCEQCIALGGEAIEKIERDQVELLAQLRFPGVGDLITDMREMAVEIMASTK